VWELVRSQTISLLEYNRIQSSCDCSVCKVRLEKTSSKTWQLKFFFIFSILQHTVDILNLHFLNVFVTHCQRILDIAVPDHLQIADADIGQHFYLGPLASWGIRWAEPPNSLNSSKLWFPQQSHFAIRRTLQSHPQLVGYESASIQASKQSWESDYNQFKTTNLSQHHSYQRLG